MLRSFALASSLAVVLFACSSTDGDALIVPHGDGPPASGASPSESSSGSNEESDAGSTTPTDPPAEKDASSPPPPVPKNYAQGKSAGCMKTTGATGLQTLTKTVGGKTRDYLRFIPAGYKPGTPVSLVFAFHGSGGTAVKARGMFDLEANGGAKAIYIYPQGLPDPAFGGDNRWDPAVGSDDYTFIDELIADVEASHCINRDRLFAVGFSNGARFTSMLGCHRGDVFRAIAPIAPGGDDKTLPLATSACKGEVAIWEGLGTEDPDHLEGATIVRDYYRTANGCAATRTKTTPAGCEKYDGCGAKLPSTWCSYPGGHMVPAFAPAAVWTFFSAL